MKEGSDALHRAAFLCSVIALATAAPAVAEDSEDSKERGAPRARGFEEFDTNGDGHISDEERAAARKSRHEQRLEEFIRFALHLLLEFRAGVDGCLLVVLEQARAIADRNPVDAFEQAARIRVRFGAQPFCERREQEVVHLLFGRDLVDQNAEWTVG